VFRYIYDEKGNGYGQQSVETFVKKTRGGGKKGAQFENTAAVNEGSYDKEKKTSQRCSLSKDILGEKGGRVSGGNKAFQSRQDECAEGELMVKDNRERQGSHEKGRRGLTIDEVNSLSLTRRSKLNKSSGDDDDESIPSSLPSLVSEPVVTSPPPPPPPPPEVLYNTLYTLN